MLFPKAWGILGSVQGKCFCQRAFFPCLIHSRPFPSLGGQLPLVFIDGLLQGAGLLAIHRAAHREAGAQDLFGRALELLGQALLPHLPADVQEHLSWVEKGARAHWAAVPKDIHMHIHTPKHVYNNIFTNIYICLSIYLSIYLYQTRRHE